MALVEAENGCNGDGGGEPDAIDKTSVMEGFNERAETRALIASLPEVHGGCITRETATERFLGETFLSCGVHTVTYRLCIDLSLKLLPHTFFPVN